MKLDVSFTAKINELKKAEESLARELNEWKAQASLESEVRRKAEMEVARMEIVVKETQEENRRLEGHIQEWKSKVKICSNNAAKSREVIDTIFALLKDFNSNMA